MTIALGRIGYASVQSHLWSEMASQLAQTFAILASVREGARTVSPTRIFIGGLGRLRIFTPQNVLLVNGCLVQPREG